MSNELDLHKTIKYAIDTKRKIKDGELIDLSEKENLISKSKLLEEMKEYRDLTGGIVRDVISIMIEVVEEQPSACDLEKIIDELEKIVVKYVGV